MTALIIGLFVGIYLLANLILLEMYIQDERTVDNYAIAVMLVLRVPLVLIAVIVTIIEEITRRTKR